MLVFDQYLSIVMGILTIVESAKSHAWRVMSAKIILRAKSKYLRAKSEYLGAESKYLRGKSYFCLPSLTFAC